MNGNHYSVTDKIYKQKLINEGKEDRFNQGKNPSKGH